MFQFTKHLLLFFSSLLFRTKWLQSSSVTMVTGEWLSWDFDMRSMVFNFPNNLSEKIWCNRTKWALINLDKLLKVHCKMCVISTNLDLLPSAVTTKMFCNCAFVLYFFKLSKLEPKFCKSVFTGSLVKYRKGYFWSKSIIINVL